MYVQVKCAVALDLLAEAERNGLKVTNPAAGRCLSPDDEVCEGP